MFSGLRSIYSGESYECELGHDLRRREWGDLATICSGACETCAINNRQPMPTDDPDDEAIRQFVVQYGNSLPRSTGPPPTSRSIFKTVAQFWRELTLRKS